MPELQVSEQQVLTGNSLQAVELGAKRVVESGRYVFDMTLGLQKVVLDEMARASDEILGRLQAEMEIASEFVARLASAHSVREIAETCSDCGHHQADAFLRDSHMLFKQSQRIYEETSKLVASVRSPIH